MSPRLPLPSTLLAALVLAACSDANHGTPVGPASAQSQGAGQNDPLQFADDSNAQAAEPINVEPFSIPDPAGATRLERLGFRAVADEAQALVTARYVEPYQTIARSLRDLIGNENLVAGSNEVDCPNGGSASVSRANAGQPGQPLARDYVFDACTVDGTTLSGSLRQRETRSGKQLTTLTELASSAERLSITGEDGITATVTGMLVNRVETTSRPDCGTGPTVVQTREIALDSVTLDDSGESLADVSYSLSTLDGHDDSGDCASVLMTRFEGESKAVLTDTAGESVAVVLTTTGTLDEESPENSEATLASRAADDSSVTITATDIDAGIAQFDLVSGDVVSATIDEFSFVRQSALRTNR